MEALFTGPEYYDNCIGPVWFEPFAADLVRRLPERPPGDVLEIACGTGIVTRKLRERVDSSLRLVATDLSPVMLDYARKKLGEHTGIEWQEADALKLPFEDRSFGALVCGFGIMFVFPDDAELRFRVPYDMNNHGLLRELLAGAQFRETLIETKRIEIRGADPRAIATGQIRGTPRSALLEKRGVSLDLVIDKVADALAKTGDDPYSGHGQAVVVEAQAV